MRLFFTNVSVVLGEGDDSLYKKAKLNMEEMLEFKNLDKEIYRTPSQRMMEKGKTLKNLGKMLYSALVLV